jgi:hypothetical protein
MDLAIQSALDRTHAHAPHVPASNTAVPAPQSGTPSDSAPAPGFSAVFASIAAAAAAAGTTVASTASPTGATPGPAPATGATLGGDSAESPFGENPWLADPTGSGPGGMVTNYNPIYFATQQTAQTVAQMVGGTVVSGNEITTAPGSPFQQNQPNLMVQLPNGGLINPGLVADIYTHGWNTSFVDQQVANEVAGATPPNGSLAA